MKQSSYEKLTFKHQFGKPNFFHRKRNQVKSCLIKKKELKRVFPDNQGKQNSRIKFRVSNPETTTTIQSTETAQKSWWIHVWCGLVVDKTSKHQKAIRQAIWLYLYLLLASNWKTGILYRRISTITSETGFNRRSVHRWISILREKGYIETRSTGRALQISISKWKPITRRKAKNKAAD
jgi:Helix-turn-helix domain